VLRGGRTRIRDTFRGQERHPIAWAWFIALVATAGSLYFSEIVGFVPCSLCWYQRIAMYPLVLVLGVGVWRGDPVVWRYALPLPLVGLAVATYHVIIQWQPAADIGACTTGVPCTGRYVAVFGFVSIPSMALAAFVLIVALLALVRTLEHVGPTADAR
jgi:disulfide bond formation protein DsbB